MCVCGSGVYREPKEIVPILIGALVVELAKTNLVMIPRCEDAEELLVQLSDLYLGQK